MFDFPVSMYYVNGDRSELMPDEGEGLTSVPLWNLAFHECMADYEGVTVEVDFNTSTVEVSGLKKIDGGCSFVDIRNAQLL